MAVSSLAEWKALAEIACPAIGPDNPGAVYTVFKVGFLAVSPADCGPHDTAGAVFEAGRYFFPTTEIEANGGKELYRLPLDLSNWAIDLIALVRQSGQNPFPTRIEFGVLAGLHYAEML